MEGAEVLSTPRQQPQRQLSTPSAPAAAHRLRAHRTIFSAALGSAQKQSGAAEQQRAFTYADTYAPGASGVSVLYQVPARRT